MSLIIAVQDCPIHDDAKSNQPKPLLDIRFSEQVTVEEFSQWLQVITGYFEREQDFVLLMQTEPNTIFPERYRAFQGKWFKQYKQQFYRYCAALIRIAQDEVDQQRMDTPALRQAWKVPYFVALRKSDAIDWLVVRAF